MLGLQLLRGHGYLSVLTPACNNSAMTAAPLPPASFCLAWGLSYPSLPQLCGAGSPAGEQEACCCAQCQGSQMWGSLEARGLPMGVHWGRAQQPGPVLHPVQEQGSQRGHWGRPSPRH